MSLLLSCFLIRQMVITQKAEHGVKLVDSQVTEPSPFRPTFGSRPATSLVYRFDDGTLAVFHVTSDIQLASVGTGTCIAADGKTRISYFVTR